VDTVIINARLAQLDIFLVEVVQLNVVHARQEPTAMLYQDRQVVIRVQQVRTSCFLSFLVIM
jgi:hypothetical protein